MTTAHAPSTRPRIARIARTPLAIVRRNLRPYLLLNLYAYGLLAVGMGVGIAVPELTAAATGGLEQDGTADLVLSLMATPWLFALTIMGVNVWRIALLSIALPSLVVPFAGILVFGWWAVDTGITLAPVSEATATALIPHSLTIVIEFQAYVLLLLGAYLLGRSWVLPRTAGASSRRRGYVRGLALLGWLAVPAAALFVVGAVYEALSLTFLVPLLLA